MGKDRRAFNRSTNKPRKEGDFKERRFLGKRSFQDRDREPLISEAPKLKILPENLAEEYVIGLDYVISLPTTPEKYQLMIKDKDTNTLKVAIARIRDYHNADPDYVNFIKCMLMDYLSTQNVALQDHLIELTHQHP